jgi:hypothetical protein
MYRSDEAAWPAAHHAQTQAASFSIVGFYFEAQRFSLKLSALSGQLSAISKGFKLRADG